MSAPASRPNGHARSASAALAQALTPTKTAQQRGRGSRTKGQTGEREVAAILKELTGRDVRRRVRQHDGDSDLEGVPGWSVEVKRHAAAPPGKLAEWWGQTLSQARDAQALPVLFYRADRAGWRCVWPAALHLPDRPAVTASILDTLDADPLTWWRMTKHIKAGVRVLP